jgi:ribosome-associated heat shock protein Hsp15
MAVDETRLDRWLWAARIFKTRGLAQEAIAGGRVHLNGQRSRAAHPLRPGDRLEVSRGEQRLELVVLQLATRRGPASVARELYAETEASQAAREAARRLRADLAGSRPPAGRPDKRDRRRIIRFVKGQAGGPE